MGSRCVVLLVRTAEKVICPRCGDHPCVICCALCGDLGQVTEQLSKLYRADMTISEAIDLRKDNTKENSLDI